MKILSIGNSFSQDAQKWLSAFAAAEGVEFSTANLYIGGCSLETHWENIRGEKTAYAYEWNGGPSSGMISVNEALRQEEWDGVTLQQVSGLSGRPQSYFPYLENICRFVRTARPGAAVYLQETWSYEVDSTHPAFADYGKSQAEMYRRLHDCYTMASHLIGAPLIPVGTVIENLRLLPAFDYPAGGLSLHRDGFHLSFGYGRYAAAATWFCFLTGKDIRENTFVPTPEGEKCDSALLRRIRETVYETVMAVKGDL